MTGMGASNGNDPAVVHAFHQLLLAQGIIVGGFVLALLVAAQMLRAQQMVRPQPPTQWPDPPARRLIRVGFGCLWILDGVLQGQAAMPQHLVPDVIRASTSGSPGWLVSAVDSTARLWTDHQVTAAASVVWIQIGIGLWLLVAPRGRWSRAAGAASALWGLVIWVFGESLGGVLAPGLSWLDGAPGAALLYAGAGALVSAPEHWWRTSRTGQWLCRTIGVALVGFAVLESWPGRDAGGNLSDMATGMSRTPQPGWIHSLVGAVAGHAGAVDAAAIVALIVIGLALMGAGPGRPRLTVGAVVAASIVCLVDWVTVQDLGFLGGVGTDPNSMLPWIVLLIAGAAATTRPGPPPSDAAVPTWRRKMDEPGFALRTFAATAAVAIILVGALPLAADSVTGAPASMGARQPVAVRSDSGCTRCPTSPGAFTPR